MGDFYYRSIALGLGHLGILGLALLVARLSRDDGLAVGRSRGRTVMVSILSGETTFNSGQQASPAAAVAAATTSWKSCPSLAHSTDEFSSCPSDC